MFTNKLWEFCDLFKTKVNAENHNLYLESSFKGKYYFICINNILNI